MSEQTPPVDDPGKERRQALYELLGLISRINDVRTKAMCDVDDSVLGDLSGQHYLLTLDALGTAHRFATLAMIHHREQVRDV